MKYLNSTYRDGSNAGNRQSCGRNGLDVRSFFLVLFIIVNSSKRGFVR